MRGLLLRKLRVLARPRNAMHGSASASAQEAKRSIALDRYAMGRARAVASLLGVNATEVEAQVLESIGRGEGPDVALDRLVLEATS
jgi:hypothetical protein